MSRCALAAVPVVVCLCAWLAKPAMGQNLLQNPNFSSGATGFTSDYSYNTSLSMNNCYVVGYNPHDHHSGGASFTDHTSGSGLMLIANGYSTADKRLWAQTVTVRPGELYEFSVWAASWAMWGGPSDPSPATLQLRINGNPVGNLFNVAPPDGQWTRFSATWDAGASTQAALSLVDTNINWLGNDFAVDDVAFSAVPEPGTLGMIGLAAALLLRRRQPRR